MSADLVLLPSSGVPVELGRDEARLRARVELTDPSYDADPGLLERAIGWVLEHLGRLLDAASSVSPGSWVGLLSLLGLLVLVGLLVRRRMGPVARSARRADPLFGGGERSAAAHRASADAAASAGDWRLAVVERYRAVVRSLEERAVLEPRPGRTADEAAREAGRRLPGLAEPLASGARIFDDVLYGGRAAGPDDHDTVRGLDEAVGRARPVLSTGPAPVPVMPR